MSTHEKSPSPDASDVPSTQDAPSLLAGRTVLDVIGYQKSEAIGRFYAEIIRTMAEGVGMARCRDGVMVWGNPAVARMFGYGEGEAIGRPVSKLFAGTEGGAEQTAADIMRHLRESGSWSGEVRSVRKDGSEFWTRMNVLTAVHPEHGEVWVGIFEDITARKAAEAGLLEANRRLSQMAYTDATTALPNRRYVIDSLERELGRLSRYGGTLVAAMVDVDGFKAVNDTHGHLMGDHVLVQVGGILRRELRQADLLGRFGGDEFVILMPETSLEAATRTMDRLRDRVKEHIFQGGRAPFSVTISAGLTLAEGGRAIGLTDLLYWADQALYAAKSAGRDCVRSLSPQTEPAPAKP